MFPGGRIVFHSYGVTAEVVVEDPSLVAEVSALLPPGWEPADGADASATFILTAGGDVIADGETVAAGAGRAAALDLLESAVRARVAVHARDHIFVHAGVVARGGRAIVIPGSTFSGKTTLVAALVRAGAEYYSDEFAVLDGEGRVHPYARPLSMRLDASFVQTDVAVATLGGVAGDGAVEVALIAATAYVAGREWDPTRGSAAEGALALLSHAIPVRERPAQALTAVRRAAEGATLFEGPRGEAEPTAEALLATLDETDVPADAAQVYLDQLKGVLTRSINEDGTIDPQAWADGRKPADGETMLGPRRIDSLHACIRAVLEEDIPGDLMETGVWRGGACIFMRAALDAYGDAERLVWLADSFAGLPPADRATFPEDSAGWLREGMMAVSQTEVEANFRRYGLLDDRVRFLPGYFRDTLPSVPVERLAILRMDGDMYESTFVALEYLYPKVAPGGFVIVDDYGSYEPCRLAVDDFRSDHGIGEALHATDWAEVRWRKRA